jgi:hypothetical protein
MNQVIPEEKMHDFFQDQVKIINHYVELNDEQNTSENVNQLANEWIANFANIFRIKWIEKNCHHNY